MAKQNVLVEMFYGGAWNAVDAYTRQPISISYGKQDESEHVTPSTCTLQLDNRDGSKNPRNPMSPLYGLVGRNTPLRIRMPDDDLDGYLLLLLDPVVHTPAKVSTPDAAALDITGDIDIRVDVAYNNWTEAGIDGGPALAGKYYTIGDNRSWKFRMDTDGFLIFEWSTLGTLASVISKTSTVAASLRLGQRTAFRVTLDVDNGAAGNTVTFYTADTIDGSWTQLGAAVVTAGVTSIFASASAPVEVGHIINTSYAAPDGRLYAFKLLNGINGTEVANPDWRDRETGGSFTDAAGRTWSEVGVVSFVPPSVRFSGEIAAWQPRRTMDFDPDTGKGDSWVEITANGILRRKNAGSKPLRSALTRTITHGPRGAFGISSAAIAHWPLEDEAGATGGASILPGIGPMTVRGTATWGNLDPVPGSAPLVKLSTSTGQLVGFVPPSAYPSGWVNTDGTVVTFVVSYADEVAGAAIFNAAIEDDQGSTWYLYGTLSGATDVIQAFQRWPTQSPGPGHIGTSPSTFTPSDDTFFQITVILSQSGANVTAQAYWYGADGLQTVEGGTVAGVTLGRVKKIQLRAGSTLNNLAFGHVAVLPTSSVSVTGLLDGALGHFGETVHDRMIRLCDEEDIVLRWQGGDAPAQMGIQQIERFPALMNQCEDVDRGILSEAREFLGLSYRSLVGLYNQDPALALDFTQAGIGAPFEPNLDDQQTRNEVTASRSGGSSAVAAQTTGPMSTAEPEDGGVGVYDDSVTVNVASDDQLPGIASWLVHLGTEEETRWPQITVDLDAAALDGTSALDAVALDVGDVVLLDNMPTDLSFNPIALLILGYMEVIESHRRYITFNCVPAAPYDIGTMTVAAGTSTTQTKVGHNGTTLGEDLTLAETLVDIEVEADTALWTTSGVDFDIIVAGERMTVTSVTDLTATTQRFTCTRSVNGVQKTHTAGEQIKLYKPAVVAM